MPCQRIEKWRSSLFPALEADSYIEDGEVIPTALGPMQALLTPGHSAGRLCFYFPKKKILLAGDQLMKPRTPHVEWNPEGSALAEFRASLEGCRISMWTGFYPRTDGLFVDTEPASK